jgi:hypothetical protein
MTIHGTIRGLANERETNLNLSANHETPNTPAPAPSPQNLQYPTGPISSTKITLLDTEGAYIPGLQLGPGGVVTSTQEEVKIKANAQFTVGATPQ